MITDSYFKNIVVTACVTLAQAKKQLRISASNTHEDDLIQGYIDAATADRQNYINRSVDTRDYVLEVSQFETVVFTENNDNDQVSIIQYYAPGETTLIDLSSDAYKVRPGTIVGTKSIKFINAPETEKRNDAVIITIKQGWSTTDVPKPFYQSIMLLVSDMYERREDRGEIGTNRAADALIRAYRKY